METHEENGMKPQGAADAASVVLPSFLDLGFASDLKAILQDAIAGDGEVVIDGSAVEGITSPCIQVLVAASATASGPGRGLRLLNATECLESAFSDLGLDHQYRSWSNNQ